MLITFVELTLKFKFGWIKSEISKLSKSRSKLKLDTVTNMVRNNKQAWLDRGVAQLTLRASHNRKHQNCVCEKRLLLDHHC